MVPSYLSASESEEEKAKFSSIYEKYYRVMSDAAAKYITSEYDIEDVVHDAMMKVIDSIDMIDLEDEEQTKILLEVIAASSARNFLNREKKPSGTEGGVSAFEDFVSDPCDIAVSHEAYEDLLKAIDSMSGEDRDICLLKYVNGLSEREIAKVLDIPRNTIKFKAYRAQRKLRDILRKGGIYTD